MNVKTLIIFLAASLCVCSIFAADSAEKKTVTVKKTDAQTVTNVKTEDLLPKDNSYLGYYNPFYCFARGMNNLVSCGAEVPRCVIYGSIDKPWYGWFVGVFEGSGLTVCRALTGCLDIVTLGLTKQSVFSERYPESPWDAKWIPAEPEPSPAETNSM